MRYSAYRGTVPTSPFLARTIPLADDLRSRSVFLFGPRQTGKTTLLRALFPDSPRFDLLQGRDFLRLAREPWRLGEELAAAAPFDGPVVIDEIQKLPRLLDEVHSLIESRGLCFVLAASSPVKLRRGGVNLLGGRARIRRLWPFAYPEIPGWNLRRALNCGSLPPIHFSSEPVEDLEAYCASWVRLEIQAEGLIRGIEPFSRFLQVAAAGAAQPIVFERIASDAQVPARTVREYFAVLDETLVATLLPPFTPRRARRKPVSRGKLFFFDPGVQNTLASTGTIGPGSAQFGPALEQLIYCELRSRMDYSGDRRRLTWWRTRDGSEVDFVVGDEVAIEVKATRSAAPRDLTGLRRLEAETPLRRRVLVCREPAPRLVDGILILPVERFLQDLWSGELLGGAPPVLPVGASGSAHGATPPR